MAAEYTCPGVTGYGGRQNEQAVHIDGCCARFILSSDERKAQTGIRQAVPEPAAPRRTYTVVPITVAQLAKLVERLQYQATADPDTEPEADMAWVEIGPDDDLDEVTALVDLARPYHLAVGYRRVRPQPPTEEEE